MEIIIEQKGEVLTFQEEHPVLLQDFLKKHHIYFSFPCAGKGNCGKCRVYFTQYTPKPTEKENRLLTEDELASGVRLACSCTLDQSCSIRLPEQEDSMQVEIRHGIFQSEKNCVGESAGERNEAVEKTYGVACDIGTTTIAMELVELASGQVIKTVSGVNHQRNRGADVLSRINYANESLEHAKELYDSIHKDLSDLLHEFRDYKIIKMVIACNVTMAHLLMGYSVAKLGEAPFEAVTLQEIETEICGIPTCIFPGMQAFIGGDITAGVYALDLDQKDESSLLVDLGTNGEMILCTTKGNYGASVAAGPAFEGGKISCGMPSVKGAIRGVMILGKLVRNQVIGNTTPQGMCGTGILEGVCELLRTGAIDENGTFRPEYREDGFCFAKDVYLTQEDIRQVQLAKASIRAGVECMIQAAGEVRVDHVYLAGGFGFSLDIAKACRIGIFPTDLKAKTVAAGNTALLGAVKYLCHPQDQDRIKRIAQTVQVLSLADDKEFQEAYIRYMNYEQSK